MLGKKNLKKTDRDFYLLKDNAPIMEAFRVLRTNLEFSGTAKKMQTVLLTSTVAKEGKSTVTCNLSKAFAYAGKKTLLIDFDLRRPVLHLFFGLENTNGMTDYLLGTTTLEEATKETGIENLYLLNSGTIPPNPAELLSSPNLAAIVEAMREKFDMIIIDTPPAAVVADATIASRFADAVLVVTAAETTRTNDLDFVLENLRAAGADIRGIIFNKVKTRKRGYKHYGYYTSEY